jgi:predicted TIM-barrel fold metal-dependent hydrolase
MRTITLEEHFATSKYMAGPGQGLQSADRIFDTALAAVHNNRFAQLCDLDSLRIADMDAAGIDMQVVSLTSPGTEQVSAEEAKAIARDTNDFAAEAVKKYPHRFAAFAALPTPDPKAAADELERTVKQYGFKGAVINGHVGGRYLDEPLFAPILECAEALNVPIYLHPTRPPQPVVQTYYTGNFAPETAFLLAIAAWGWHIETAIHVIRLIASGTFDRYPKLQVIVGHMGEGLPFMQQRMDRVLSPQATKLQRPFSAYLRENVHYTFSGFNYPAVFQLLLAEVGIERIMFSADYPYQPMQEAQDFLDQLPISAAEKEQIAHGNAERLLGL